MFPSNPLETLTHRLGELIPGLFLPSEREAELCMHLSEIDDQGERESPDQVIIAMNLRHILAMLEDLKSPAAVDARDAIRRYSIKAMITL
jgi:hypothetical protein